MIERVGTGLDAAVDRVGGKTAGLMRLIAAGLTVPEAWVIPAAVSLDPPARRRCLDELAVWWTEAGAQFPGAQWAVRSSAVAEDLDGASFAGVYETVLGVTDLDGLRDAVESGWQAHESARAQVYRGERDIGAGGGIALLLQRMVRPRAAGVLLTVNPQRPFADEIVIDAAWGLGEAIVSGKVDPDHIVLQRSTGIERSRRVSTKLLECVYDGGILDREVPVDRQNIPCLDGAALAALYAMARTVGDRIGPARDLEWALEGTTVYALQDRPITSLPSGRPHNVWSRKWGDEYKSEYALPLTADLTAGWMDIPMFIEMVELQGRPDLAVREPFRMVNGYMYIDGDYVASMARAVPKSMRRQMFGDLFTPLWLERIEAQPYDPWLTWKFATAYRRDRGRGTMKDNLAALARHCAAIDTRVVPKLRQDYSALGLAEWRRQADEIESFGQDHFRILRWGMGFHNNLLHRLLSGMLESQAGDDGQLYAALIGGLPGTRTAEINVEIWDLAMLARSDAGLADALRARQPWSQIRAQHPEFGVRFERFLRNHGHRSSSRDIASPRWSEEPDVVLGLIRAQVQAPTAPEDPRKSEQRATETRSAAHRDAVARLRRGPLGSLRAKVFETVCRNAQVFTVYRENQRYHLDYLNAQLRGLVLEQGRRFVERGLLADLDDVFLMTGAEFWAALDGAVDPIDRDGMEARRRNYLTFRSRMPATYLFDEVETEGEVAEGDSPDDQGDAGMAGLGACRGTARGRTRCVAELADLADVTAGDVLVAKTIDPGWTSVFPLLAGLITETGGMLSHGAILAREYGIPTVTAVAGAIELLPTGTLVEIDGTAGAVRVPEWVDV